MMQAFTKMLHRHTLNFLKSEREHFYLRQCLYSTGQHSNYLFLSKKPVFGQCIKYCLERSQDSELRVLGKWLLFSVLCKPALNEEVQCTLNWYYFFLIIWEFPAQIPDLGQGCVNPPDLLAPSWLKLEMKFRTKCTCYTH